MTPTVSMLLAGMAPGSIRSTADLAQCLGWSVLDTDATCAKAAEQGHVSFTTEGWVRPDTPEARARRMRVCPLCNTEHEGDCPEEEDMAKKAPKVKKKTAAKKSPAPKNEAASAVDVRPILEQEKGTCFEKTAPTRVAVPEVDDDGIERPSVTVHKAPAQDVPTGSRYLKHLLSADEIEDKRLKREAGDAEVDALQDEIDKATKQLKSMKSRHELLVEDGLKVSRIIRDGFEYQNVSISERRCEDGREELVRVGKAGEMGVGSFRDDTGELIDWRPLTTAERQGKLFDDPAPKDGSENEGTQLP